VLSVIVIGTRMEKSVKLEYSEYCEGIVCILHCIAGWLVSWVVWL
jgi:hypothetical protein